MRSTPLAQGDIEAAILKAIEDMESLTELYAEVSDAEAEAENAYKRQKWSMILNLSTRTLMDDAKTKATAQWREAKAETLCAPEADAHRLATARARSTREALSTKRARLDALRSLAANVRAQT